MSQRHNQNNNNKACHTNKNKNKQQSLEESQTRIIKAREAQL